MLISFENAIGAIADAMVRRPQASTRRIEKVESVSAFLLKTHAKMPDYLRLSIHILTLLFDAWPYPVKGKPFHRLDLAERRAQIESWETSGLEFRRNLMVFYTSIATFGLYSELYGQNYEWSEHREQR